ncbi:MAG: hypothetical protein EHM87_08195 [Burkholderiales bacterium]|nr:MAG: hypothetical protein EHM87_08195 [Burkholderiales bacterium]
MSAPAPTLLLPAALADPAWLGADRMAGLAREPGWSALARRSRTIAQAGPEDRPSSDPGHERWLRTRLGLPADAALAACAALADAAPQAAWRLDPVHLHVGRDHLVLTDPGALALDEDDARALADSIAPLFVAEGLALEVPGPTRWYLRELDPARPLRLVTRPLAGAIGRNIDAWQPTGDDVRRWRRLVNEVQMTWHAHPLNARREFARQPTVNSLWIEGRVPPATPGARAAARLAVRDDDRSREPDTGDDRTLDLDTGDGHLLVDDRLLAAQLAGDPQQWAEAWRALDGTVFAAMARAEGPWRTGARLVLAGDAGWREIGVAPRADWRFWRRADAAALLAEPSAARSATP